MFGKNRKRGVGSAAARGLLFDTAIRRAAAQAVPPVARLSLNVGRRMARRRAERRRAQVAATMSAVSTLLVSNWPHVAGPLGLTSGAKPTHSRTTPSLIAGVALGAAGMYLFEPGHGQEHRRQVQRLIAH
jgi:hypothetical protein